MNFNYFSATNRYGIIQRYRINEGLLDSEILFSHNYSFDIQRTVPRDIILQLNQRDALISQIYLWNRTLHVSDSFSVHHQESSTVHTAIGICHTGYADCLLAGSGCSILIPLVSSQHNLYDIYVLLCVQCQTPDDGQRTCSKHVEFYSKDKFEKLVHLVGLIVRLYHEARSSECQMSNCG